jgi:hypothetical protein
VKKGALLTIIDDRRLRGAITQATAAFSWPLKRSILADKIVGWE